MKIRKGLLIDRIQYYFLYLFPFTIIFFSPSKVFFGFLSITDLFVGLSIFVFFIYSELQKIRINNKSILLIVLLVFSFTSLLVNEQFEFIHKIKYQIRWLFYISTFIVVYNYLTAYK